MLVLMRYNKYLFIETSLLPYNSYYHTADIVIIDLTSFVYLNRPVVSFLDLLSFMDSFLYEAINSLMVTFIALIEFHLLHYWHEFQICPFVLAGHKCFFFFCIMLLYPGNKILESVGIGIDK